MSVCQHPLGVAVRKQQPLRHPALVEAQIELGHSIKPFELLQWSTGQIEPLGPIREEALVFLILHSRFADEVFNEVNDLATIVVQRIKSAITHSFCNYVYEERIEAFGDVVSQLFWLRVLDHEDATAAWAQVAFWPFVFTLAKGLLKRERFEHELFISFESDRVNFTAHDRPVSRPLSMDLVLIEELLDYLNPIQRRAFVLRYYEERSLQEIGKTLNRTERSVRNILRASEDRLRPYLG